MPNYCREFVPDDAGSMPLWTPPLLTYQRWFVCGWGYRTIEAKWKTRFGYGSPFGAISYRTINQYELGVRIPNAIKLSGFAEILGVEVGFFFTRSKEEMFEKMNHRQLDVFARLGSNTMARRVLLRKPPGYGVRDGG
jgi:hypothetical protein